MLSGLAEGVGLLPEQETALQALARCEPFQWVELTSDQVSALFAKAEDYLKRYKQYHLPQGLNADLWWVDRERSKPHMYDGIGDSACWQGHYLAALALRFHVTQDPQTRADILVVLDSFDLLTTVTGRDGYVARYAGDANDPAYREYYRVYGRGESSERPGLGKSAYRGVEPHDSMVWLGNSSRDTYDGTSIGLATVWAFVKDAEVHDRVRRLVERIADRLIADGWTLVDGQGHTTRATPSWKLAWMRLILSANPDKYASLQAEYDAACEPASSSGPRIRAKWSSEYFPANLDFIRMFVLAILETDQVKQEKFKAILRNAYTEQTKDHLNAHFAALYMVGTGDTSNANARATLQGMLCDFPDPPKWLRAVDHRNDPNIKMHNEDFTEYALLAHERTVSDFIWQRPPCLSHAGADESIEFPGIDVFLPYWLGRVCGVIPAPKTSPRILPSPASASVRSSPAAGWRAADNQAHQ
jgi:hypothetical protein